MRRILLLAVVLGFALLAHPVAPAMSLGHAAIHGPAITAGGPQEPCNSGSTPC